MLFLPTLVVNRKEREWIGRWEEAAAAAASKNERVGVVGRKRWNKKCGENNQSPGAKSQNAEPGCLLLKNGRNCMLMLLVNWVALRSANTHVDAKCLYKFSPKLYFLSKKQH